MVFVVYTQLDQVSASAAEAMKEEYSFKESSAIGGMKHFKSEKAEMLELNTTHLYADFLDDYIKNDTIVFLSRHGSIKNIPALTVHPEGNLGNEAKLGGKPNELSVSDPIRMARTLCALKKNNKSDVPVTYEATHHGPLLKTSSFYAEIGGTQEIRESNDFARLLSKSVIDAIDDEMEFDKIAVGIGGLHYSDRFAKLSFEGKRAFSHIIPRHYVDNTNMFKQAIERSVPKAEIAIIDWKSLTAEQRENSIKMLGKLGIDYEKI